jgi:hypothetical protein
MLLTEWNQDEALEVAREEGLIESQMKIARNLLSEGSSTDFVQKITGLDLDAIEVIKQRL